MTSTTVRFAIVVGAMCLAQQGFAQAPIATPSTEDVAFSAPEAGMTDDAIAQRLELAEERIDWLLRQSAAVDVSQTAYREATTSEINGTTSNPAITPEYPAVRLSGFFHLDSGFFSQDELNRQLLGDIQDGTGFRRARLQALGSVADNTDFSIEMDFATAGRPSFQDVWGEQQDVPFFGNVRIGHFRQPFSMESITSIRQLEFLERSLPFQAFVAFRRIGIMAYDSSFDGRSAWAYGVYRTGGFNNAPLGDSRFATDIGDNGGYSFVTRASRVVVFADEGRVLLHIGGSYNYSRLTESTSDGNIYEARAIPEFFVGDPAGGGLTVNGTPFFLDTGRLAANQYNLGGIELAGQYDAFHFQTEYMATFVDQIAAPTVYYDGAYLQVGYFLTGESRAYNQAFGVLDYVQPYSNFLEYDEDYGGCGLGAWELVARWSYLNLNDPDAAPIAGASTIPPSPNPGRMFNTTVGVNWFWNRYAKVQFNWIHCALDSALAPESDADIFATRFEVAF